MGKQDGTTVFGSSDDNVCFDGEYGGEVGCYGTDDREKGVLLCFSDGTVLEAKYGKDDKGIWGVRVIEKGDLFVGIDPCTDEDAAPYSDVASFGPGIKWVFAAKDNWERVA